MRLIQTDRHEVHTYAVEGEGSSDGRGDKRAAVHVKNGELVKVEISPAVPKTREDWAFFAAVHQKIEELTTHASTIEEWSERKLGDLPSARDTDDLVKAFEENTKADQDATDH
jgi:hypothetical protein